MPLWRTLFESGLNGLVVIQEDFMHSVLVAGGQARSGGRAGHSLPRLAYLGPLSKHSSKPRQLFFVHISRFCHACATLSHQNATQWHAAGSHPLPHSSFYSRQGSSGEPRKHPHDNFSRSGQQCQDLSLLLTYTVHCIHTVFVQQWAADRYS